MAFTTFKITDFVEFNSKNRAECPSCLQRKGTDKKLNLSLIPNTDGAYKCHAGCSTDDIREALGARKPQQIPSALAQASPPAGKVTVTPQKVKEAHERLVNSDGAAKQWLSLRGIDAGLIARHQLGITRAKVGDRHLPAITIPIPNADGTAYWQKKRVAPWLLEAERPAGYQPWSQYGIPARVFFTWLPAEAKETWLCEGEWDAIVLGQLARTADLPIAVASFTCGCGTVPPQEQLELLPGNVVIFYDRNDKPTPKGERPGDVGAKKVALALGDRSKIAQVPMPEDCPVQGWDVTNAIQNNYGIDHFIAAAAAAVSVKNDKQQLTPGENPLKFRMVSTDELVARAPEFVEWLVPDLLTADELFVLGSPPRGGKSLMCMLLARSIASGQPFLDRPVNQGSVLYVNLEDSEAKVRERVEAQQWTQGLPVFWIDKFKLEETPHLIDLAKEIPDLRLIILDTLSRIRSSDISESAAEMSQVLEPLQEFAKKSKVCILLVHHTRKLTVQEDTIDVLFDSLRGSSAIRGTCRGMLIIAPADNNTYRLAVENGWGKHDLKTRLNTDCLEWQLLGKWSPLINVAQKDLALDFLNKVGSATLDTISEQTGIAKRSLHVVLDRLRRDGMVEKVGSQRAAVYQRPVQQVQQLNSLLNSAKPDPSGDRAVDQQKNNIFSSGDQRESDHTSHAKDDHFSPNDHFSRKALFVEEGDQQASNANRESVTAVQQNVNNSSTVELEGGVLKQGDRVKYRGERTSLQRVCGSKILMVLEVEGDQATLKHKDWLVTQTAPIADLVRVR